MMSHDRRSSPARHVHRLHVRASADEDASRAATLLADALRTASLPGADDGCLVVIRRLDLGRIPAGVPPATLALRIERVTREVLSQAVVYDDQSAGAADVVTFPSRGAALISLARQHARGARTTEWFWPMVVPRWRTADRTQRWLLLLDAVHVLPEALLIAAGVVEHAMRAGAVQELLSAIPRGRGDVWLGQLPASQDAAGPSKLPAYRKESLTIIEHAQTEWESSDDRLVWLAVTMTVREHPAMAASSELRATARKTLQRLQPARPLSPKHTTSGSLPSRESPLAGDSVHSLATTAKTSSGAAPDNVEHEPTVDSEDSNRWLRGSATDHAGLFFLVPILRHLGFEDYIASRPYLLTIAFPSRLLSFIGRRVGMHEDDPVAMSLSWVDSHPPRSPTFILSDMPDRMRRVLLTPAPRVVLDTSYVAWLTAVRRWCRREARIGLRTMICRPGRVFQTRTHTGVRFAMSQLDIRIRRLALDTDPGWVPWLGRTISFEYVRGDQRAR